MLPSCDRTSIIFTLKHQVGALARALQVFQELGINVLHIELHSGNESETVKSHVGSRRLILKEFSHETPSAHDVSQSQSMNENIFID